MNVKLTQELESFPFRNARYTNDKLIASSPFGSRDDSVPSFYVNLDESSEYFGYWNDKGATDPNWASGGPIKLYAFMRNITYDEARAELYGDTDDEDNTQLNVRRLRISREKSRPKPIDIQRYIQREIDYLTNRGIVPAVQRVYQCGYDSTKNAVVMPWCDATGRAVNAKFRATWGKAFWYAKGGAPVKSMIYGIDIAYKRNINVATVCEAEIDAMSSATCGTLGLAVGGAEFTDEKAELVRRSPIKTLYIAGDNDKAGDKLKQEITSKLSGDIALYNVKFPEGIKDYNELLTRCGEAAVRDAISGAERIGGFNIRLVS